MNADRRPHRFGRRRLSGHGWTAYCAAALLCCALAVTAEPPSQPSGAGEMPRPLRLIQPAATSGLDPHLMDTKGGHSVLINIFDALIEIDAAGQPQPGLARVWRQEDPRRWIFELQPNVSFHDDKPLTAKDVVASLRRAKEHPRSQVASYAAAIDSVQADGETRVKITTRHPTPTLLLNLSNLRIVPSGSPEAIEHPIGS